MPIDAKDVEVTNPPSDGISELAFSPQSDHLAVASWNNEVRVYQVHPNGYCAPETAYYHGGPALCVTWSKDGTKLVSGGADNAGRMIDAVTGQLTQIAQHSAPIKSIQFLDDASQVVVTGSWDKTLKYWDLRSSQLICSVNLPERCYTMDVTYPLMVVGCANNHICIFDLKNPTVIYKNTASLLKWQTRVVTCFPDMKGYAVGSIEGKVGIQYVGDQDQKKSFSFQCQRDNARNIFAVNAISFHPQFGTFSTAGSDGTVSFWDKESRQRLKRFADANGAVSSTAFNRNGNMFAYAVSYDWSKGYKFANANYSNKIFLHAVKEIEVKPRVFRRR